jgi:hypothetical protein
MSAVALAKAELPDTLARVAGPGERAASAFSLKIHPQSGRFSTIRMAEATKKRGETVIDVDPESGRSCRE